MFRVWVLHGPKMIFVILIALFCYENGHDVPFQAEEYAFNWCKEFSIWRVPEFELPSTTALFLEAMQQTMSLDVSTSKLPSLKLTTSVPLKKDVWLEHWEMILFLLKTNREWKQKGNSSSNHLSLEAFWLVSGRISCCCRISRSKQCPWKVGVAQRPIRLYPIRLVTLGSRNPA